MLSKEVLLDLPPPPHPPLSLSLHASASFALLPLPAARKHRLRACVCGLTAIVSTVQRCVFSKVVGDAQIRSKLQKGGEENNWRCIPVRWLAPNLRVTSRLTSDASYCGETSTAAKPKKPATCCLDLAMFTATDHHLGPLFLFFGEALFAFVDNPAPPPPPPPSPLPPLSIYGNVNRASERAGKNE